MRLNHYIIDVGQTNNYSSGDVVVSEDLDFSSTNSEGFELTKGVGFAALRDGVSAISRTSQGCYNIFKINDVLSSSESFVFDGKLSARPEDNNSSNENLVVADVIMIIGTRK